MSSGSQDDVDPAVRVHDIADLPNVQREGDFLKGPLHLASLERACKRNSTNQDTKQGQTRGRGSPAHSASTIPMNPLTSIIIIIIIIVILILFLL